MFGGVGTTGKIVHQLCHMTFHAEEVMGAEGARNLLADHPFLVEHRPCSGRALEPDWDQFWFSHGLSQFWFVLPREKLSIQFHGNEAFKGFTGVATGKGKYMVTLHQPLTGGFGAKAKPLAKWFVKEFDAIDTTLFSSR